MSRASRRVVLASASASRRQLLRNAGVQFEIVPADIDESARDGEGLVERARRLAVDKARAVAAVAPDALVIGGDQVGYVSSTNRELTKCSTIDDAREQLLAMSGRAHVFVSAAAVVLGSELVGTAEERATVTFRELTAAEIEAYLATDEWRGTCGAYRYEGEGRSLVAASDGPVTAILGFPLDRVLGLL